MPTASTLPKREELARELTWNLESIYATNDLWEAEFRQADELLPSLQGLAGTIGQGPAQLLAALKLRDDAAVLIEKLYVYSSMRSHENTANSFYQGMYQRAISLVTRYQAATAFFAPEILDLDDATFEQFLRDEPALELYRFHLEDQRRLRAHVRSAEVEAVLAQAGEVLRAPSMIFSMLNDADIKFPKVRDDKGNEVELTKSRYISLFLESRDREVRRNAYEAFYGTYASLRNTGAATLFNSVRGDVFDAKVHGYNSALEAALEPDSIPLSVYHNLIEAVNRNLPLLHRYQNLRKRALGVDKLRFYDLYVPLAPGQNPEVSYDEARERVLNGLKPLGQEYSDVLKRGLYEERWVDVPENEGKRGGAYSHGSYATQPFILMNWQDNFDNMYTLAHEFGHSMHSYFTRGNQPAVYGSYTIFVAEVASTCNEALLTAHLLDQITDPELRLHIVNQEVDKFRATLFRQTMFAEFELETHRRVEAGEALTTDLLCEIYRDLVARYHGPDVEVDDQIALEWMRIPHFYSAFYVYKYATGLSAATALSSQILSEGQPAVDRYLNFLKGGSSKTSIELLKGAGVDMTTPEPVDQALAVFGKLLDQLEELLGV